MSRRGPFDEHFSGLASGYDAFRPSYPDACVDAMLEDLGPGCRAVDVGCGTGILTRLLASRGVEVVGVDPNLDMIDVARASLPPAAAHRVRFVIGHAEQMAIGDGAADLVLCGQSFHWFDPGPTLTEFARVLRSGGRLAIVWNVRDVDTEAGAAYEAVMERARFDADTRGRAVRHQRSVGIELGPHFEGRETLRFANLQPMTLDGLLGRAASASYFPRKGTLRTELDDELRRIFAAYSRQGVLALPQVSELTRATRA